MKKRDLLRAIFLAIVTRPVLSQNLATKAKSVREFGAFGDGKNDDSEAILQSSRSNYHIYFPSGRYRFTSNKNPTFPNGVTFSPNAHIDGQHYEDIFSFSQNGLPIGLHHNHLQEDNISRNENIRITTGYIFPAPTSLPKPNKKIKVIAHWYNDFGLESTRQADGRNGALTWYYWSWAFTTNKDSYDPSRHPLLGWYRGDDVNVLDWQCYWLIENGVTVVNISGALDHENWDNPAHKDYWKYVLFNKTKNFKSLKYILWMPTKGTQKYLANGWKKIASTIGTYKNYFSFSTNHQPKPVFYLFEFPELYIAFEKSASMLSDFLIDIVRNSDLLQYQGVVIFARHYNNELAEKKIELEKNGVYIYNAGYSEISGGKGKTYAERLETAFSSIKPNEIINISTSLTSKKPHPSNWTISGSTPEAFNQLVKKAIQLLKTRKDLPQAIQIYNVAEWAEGGPGLQPNRRDGFKYLEAVKSATKFI